MSFMKADFYKRARRKSAIGNKPHNQAYWCEVAKEEAMEKALVNDRQRHLKAIHEAEKDANG